MGHDTYQLTVQKGCSRKTAFINSLSNGAGSAKKRNDNCYQTDKNTDYWNKEKQEYVSLQTATGPVLKLSSSEVFKIKDSQTLTENIEWQMEACHCDWSMCNSAGHLLTVVSLTFVWVPITVTTWWVSGNVHTTFLLLKMEE